MMRAPLVGFVPALLFSAAAAGQTVAPRAAGRPVQAAAETHIRVTLVGGRIWVSAERASLADILAEYGRRGGVGVDGAAGLPSTPVSIELADVAERQALEMLLRGAAGFVLVPRPMPAAGTSDSQFARVVIVPLSARAGSSAAPAPAAAAAVGSFPVAPGVNRLLGPDGQPVPDDQEGEPVVQPLPAPPAPKRPGGIPP